MEISTVVIGIILFAIATMIIYGWGLVKQKNQSSDLMNMLFSKGNSKGKKYLKKNKIARLATIHPTTTHFFASIFSGRLSFNH